MLDAARMLVYKAAAMKDAMDAAQRLDEGLQAGRRGRQALRHRVGRHRTRIATQVFGGYGFMEEYPVARFYRDAKVLEIGEGTREVQRMLIARGLGLPVEWA